MASRLTTAITKAVEKAKNVGLTTLSTMLQSSAAKLTADVMAMYKNRTIAIHQTAMYDINIAFDDCVWACHKDIAICFDLIDIRVDAYRKLDMILGDLGLAQELATKVTAIHAEAANDVYERLKDLCTPLTADCADAIACRIVANQLDFIHNSSDTDNVEFAQIAVTASVNAALKAHVDCVNLKNLMNDQKYIELLKTESDCKTLSAYTAICDKFTSFIWKTVTQHRDRMWSLAKI